MKYPYEDVLEQIQYLIAAVALPLVWAMGAYVVALLLGPALKYVFVPSRRLQDRHEWQTPQKDTRSMSTLAIIAASGAVVAVVLVAAAAVTDFYLRVRG